MNSKPVWIVWRLRVRVRLGVKFHWLNGVLDNTLPLEKIRV